MTNIVTVGSALVDFLRSNVPTPHSGTFQWIYMDYPRSDATFPRISVTHVSGTTSEMGIGGKVECAPSTFTYGQLAEMTYDIDVWVNVADRATYSGTVYVGTKLRDYLADLVMLKLENGKETLKSTAGIIDVEFANVMSVPFDESFQRHRKTISTTVSYIWGLS